MQKKLPVILIAATSVALAACSAFSDSPDAVVNKLYDAYNQGNIVSAKQYLAASYMGMPRDSDRLRDVMMTTMGNVQKNGGAVLPVATKEGCFITGEMAKCTMTFKWGKYPNLPPAVSEYGKVLIKQNGQWLIQGEFADPAFNGAAK